MRSLHRSALVGVSAVVALLGVIPAANAADSSIAWSQDSGVLSPGWNPQVCGTQTAFEPGQTVAVQVLQDATWVDKGTFSPDPSYGWCSTIDVTALVPGPGTYSFRAVSHVPSTGELVMTAEATYTLQPDDGRILWASSDEFQASTEWVAASRRLNMRSPSDLITSVQVLRAHGQVVALQRKSGASWVDVSSTTAPASGDGVTVGIRIPVHPGMATHRFVSHATTWTPEVTSPPFDVYQTAALNTASYIAEARSYMAAYCPQTPVYIDTPAVRSGWELGRASGSWRSVGPRGRRYLVTKIELRSGMSPDKLRFVALHECGHILQFRSAVPGHYADVVRQAKKLWPGLGVEGQADCMAYQVTRDPYWFGYVNGCSNAQLVNAAQMWQAYGKKYQAAVYRW